jgi:predicted negative regulator of RcsB-dependent stress response
MKSEHRHELETNWLAHHVAIWLDKVQPYNSLIVGGLLALAAILFGYSYFGNESSTRQSDAWNSYNEAVGGMLPNLDKLDESADEYPDSPVQQLADITWADGQVAIASRYYLQNRKAADEAADRAIRTYQSLLSATDDQRIKSRAHFGLARVYELKNELDKAKAEYKLVTGGFAALAEQRLKDLDKPDTIAAYAWLATAESPRITAPAGPGIPGVSPGFTPGEIDLPAATTGTTPATEEPAGNISIDDLFQGIGDTPANTESNTERYEGDATDAEKTPATGETSGDAKSDDAQSSDATKE